MNKEIRNDEDDYDEEGAISVLGNRIFFYSGVDTIPNMELNRILYDLDEQLKDEKNPIIHLHIKSNGGEAFSAFSTVDTMKQLRAKVHTYIDGFAASAATIISCAGHKRMIGKHSFAMIHQCSNSFAGKYTEIEDNMSNITCIMDTIFEFYKKNTKIPSKKLKDILNRDRYITSTDCLNYGLVDKII